MPDRAMASLLNRWGKRTAKGHTWTEARVCSFRHDHEIAVYRNGEREARGEITLEQAAKALGVSEMTVLRMIRSGLLPGEQVCKGAPWVILRTDLDRTEVRQAAAAGSNLPLTANPDQISLELQ